MTSVLLSMTITAAVPRPDCASLSASKSISTLSQIWGSKGHGKQGSKNIRHAHVPSCPYPNPACCRVEATVYDVAMPSQPRVKAAVP